MQIKARIPIDLGAENRRYDRKPPNHRWLHWPHRPQPELYVSHEQNIYIIIFEQFKVSLTEESNKYQ